MPPLPPARSQVEAVALVGFGLVLALSAAAQLFASHLTSQITAAEDDAFEQADFMVDAERLRFRLMTKVANARAFLVTGDESYRTAVDEDDQRIAEKMQDLRGRIYLPEGKQIIAELDATLIAHGEVMGQLMQREQSGASAREVAATFLREVRPRWEAMDAAMKKLADYKERRLAESRGRMQQVVARARTLSQLSALGTLLIGGILALVLTRRIRALVDADATARRAAEALAAELGEQSREVADALNTARADKERAEARVAELERKPGAAG